MNYLINFMASGGVSSSTNGTAAGAAGQGGFFGGSGSMILIFVVFFAVLYFFSIRPNKKREKEQKNKLAAIKKGDRVQTIGGWRGTVVSIKENTFVLRIDNSATVEIIKNAISDVIDKKGDSFASSVKNEAVKESNRCLENEAVDVEATVVKTADGQDAPAESTDEKSEETKG